MGQKIFLPRGRRRGCDLSPELLARLKAERLAQGLDANELGRRCGTTGSNVRRAERGESVAWETLALWASKLGVEIRADLA